MILSMTGFGKAVKVFGNKKITVEIKSLNSKQVDMSMRLPQVYHEIELELRNKVSTSLQRGKIDVFIYCETIDGNSPISLNIPLLKQYKSQIETMSNELEIDLPADWYATLLRLPETLISEVNCTDIQEEEFEAVRQTVTQAIDALIDFRTQEGRRLEQFFVEKIQDIQSLLNEVPQYEGVRIEKIKSRINDALAKLEGVTIDNNRFEQELIFYIEKFDITEEKIRLQNHLQYFLDTLHNGSGQGKKLGFISQEMGREINTTGSKANEAELQKVVVRMKDHLEQIKEQVLNVL